MRTHYAISGFLGFFVLLLVNLCAMGQPASQPATAPASQATSQPASAPADDHYAKQTQAENLHIFQSAKALEAWWPAAPDWAQKLTPGVKVSKEHGGWFAAPKPREKPELPAHITRAFVIPIREEISEKTFHALTRKVLRCQAKGAQIVILDMDTWGGGVLAALDMTRLIKHELDDVYVVCYARTRAISAGAMIAVSCDEIIMNPIGKLGDCAPIVMGGKLEGVEREKIETVIRTEFEESAERNGYSLPLATSMVSYDQEVWLIRNPGTHELKYVLAEDYRNKVSDAPDAKDKSSDSLAKSVERIVKSHEKTVDTPKPTATNATKKTDPREWEFVSVIVPEGKLLTMQPKKALEYGFASNLIKGSSENPYAGLMEHYHITVPPTVLEDSWSEDLVDFLTSPAIAGLLVFLMFLFAYVEIHTPGFGVFGGIAIFCLVTLLCSQYLVGLAQWWEIAVLVLGILLLLLEIFVIPGFGVAGISGILLILIGALAMIIPNAPDRLPIPTSGLSLNMFTTYLFWMSIGFIAAVAMMGILTRYLPKLPILARVGIVMPEVAAAVDAPRPENSPLFHIQPGDIGVALSTLRPSGEVQFGDDVLDAVADGSFIERGTKVRVLHRDGNRIVVEEMNKS